MTSRERILATIRGEPVDKIPVYHLQFSGHAASVILGRPDVCIGGGHNQWLEINARWNGPDAHEEFVAQCEEDAVAVTRACGMDLLRLDYWRWGERPARKIDDSTFLFGDPDGAWYTVTYDSETELLTRENGGVQSPPKAAEGPEPWSEEWLREEVERAEEKAAAHSDLPEPDPVVKARVEKYPDYLIRHGGGSVRLSMSDPLQLMATALHPDLFARLLMARAQMLAQQIPALAQAGLEVNITGGDFCSARAPCVSPDTFRHIVVPALKHHVEACHKHGMFYFYNSDGNFWPVAEDMFNTAGVDGWLETDRSAGMDLRRLRERFPHATIQGNIRVQVVHRGNPDDVRREVRECMQVAHDLGGIIVGTSNLIMPGTPPENIETLLKTIEETR